MVKNNNKINRRGRGLTEQADVNLLQRVNAAELVELVVDLVENQSLVVVGREVPHNVVHCRADGDTHNTSISLCCSQMFPGVAAELLLPAAGMR